MMKGYISSKSLAVTYAVFSILETQLFSIITLLRDGPFNRIVAGGSEVQKESCKGKLGRKKIMHSQ